MDPYIYGWPPILPALITCGATDRDKVEAREQFDQILSSLILYQRVRDQSGPNQPELPDLSIPEIDATVLNDVDLSVPVQKDDSLSMVFVVSVVLAPLLCCLLLVWFVIKKNQPSKW